MRPAVSPNVIRVVASLALPERFAGPLISYAQNLITGLAPQCIVLYGSLAKGTYTTGSDIDLVVVAARLPGDFHDRLRELQELNNTGCPIDAFAYTPEEFWDMLERGHVTALDAAADGVPVYGGAYFRSLRKEFLSMVRRGLHRSSCSWVLPHSS